MNSQFELSKLNDYPCIPPGCLPLEHQVAGHFNDIKKTKLEMLQTNDGYVLKPIQSRMNGKRELDFFIRLFCTNNNELNEHEYILRKFIPFYRGILKYDAVTYIKMDDLAYGLHKPSILDLKIGRKMYDSFATQDKINRQKIKYPKSEIMGFQISGMRVYDLITDEFIYYDKIFGRNIDENDIIHCLALFYQFQNKAQINALRATIKKLEEIKNWFNKQKTYQFYSSSILVMYESDMEYLCNKNFYIENQDAYANLVRVSMIDFTHVVHSTNEIDTNYLFGLENLINFFKSLLHSDYKFKYIEN